MTNIILEELAPNTNVILRDDYAVIESNTNFDENAFSLPDDEIKYATPLGRKIDEIIPQLLEQDLASIQDGKICIPYTTFKYLYLADLNDNEEMGYNLSEYLPKYSPFFLKIESHRDLGSPEFEYDYHYYWGIKEVFPKRMGCFLSYKSKNYYLEENLFNLLVEMDSFNSLDSASKNKVNNLKKFAIIKNLIEKVNGIETDKYIENENVVLPKKVQLNIVQNEGGVSIEPIVVGVSEISFKTQYEGLKEVQDVYDTDVEGKRTRVVFDNDIKVVSEKLKKEYSNRKISEISEKIKNPREIFREVEGIDQDVIDCTGYSDRVKGIGEYAFKPKCQFNSSGVDFLENINFKELSEEKIKEITDKFKPVISAQTIDDDNVDIPVDYETIKTIEDAISNNIDSVKLVSNEGKEVTVPITEEISAFVKDNSEIFSPDVDLEEKKKRIKKYLIIHDNFEEQTYAEHQNKTEEKELIYQRPNSLNDILINKKGEEIPLELYEYQREGVAWLEAYYEEQHKKGALLADDMGLGKTLQVLTFLAWMIEKKEKSGEQVKPILIVAPPILLQNWYDEIQRFFKGKGSVFTPITILHGEDLKRYKRSNIGPENLAHSASLCVDCPNCEFYSERGCRSNKNPIESNRIVITNYDTVKNYQFSLGKIEWMGVVLDEAQYIKEPDTGVTFAIKTINSEFKLAMTGTPVENKLLDLWSIMDFASPGLLGTRKEFLQNYDINNKIDSDERQNRLSALKQTLKLTKFKGLNKPNVIPHIVRREKSEYLADKLPLKHDGKDAIRIECEIPEDMAEIHQALLQQAMETEARNHLMIIQKLIKLYQHKILLENSKKEYTPEEYLKTSPKLVATIEELKKIQAKGEKALIFVTSISMQNILKKVIDHSFNLNVGIINGTVSNITSHSSTSKSARYRILDNFESKEGFNVLILSPHVAGIGLTILGANHVIHYGRWWNPAKESQATDRAYRIGQDKEVFVYYPVYKSTSFETFDEKLDRLIEGKKALARDFLTPIEDLEVSATEMLFDLTKESVSTQKTTSSLVNVEALSETEFKNLVYILLTKEGENISYINEQASFGIDLIKNENELIKTFITSFDELDLDAFALNINKLNKNGQNYIFTAQDVNKNVINYAKENDINVYTKKDLVSLIKKHKVTKNDLLTLIVEKKNLF